MNCHVRIVAQEGNCLLSWLFAIKVRDVLRITLFILIVDSSEINVWKAENGQNQQAVASL